MTISHHPRVREGGAKPPRYSFFTSEFHCLYMRWLAVANHNRKKFRVCSKTTAFVALSIFLVNASFASGLHVINGGF